MSLKTGPFILSVTFESHSSPCNLHGDESSLLSGEPAMTHLKIGLPPVAYEQLFEASAAGPHQLGNVSWQGFLPFVIEVLAKRIGFTFTLVVSPPLWAGEAATGQTGQTGYGCLATGRCDLVFTDLTQVHGDLRVMPSAPFHDSFNSGLALKTSKPIEYFRFLEPFSPDLYVLIFGFAFVCAAMYILVDIVVPTYPRPGVVKTVYSSVAALFHGEDYLYLTWPSRIIRIGMLLVVFIVNAHYTANLTVFLCKCCGSLFDSLSLHLDSRPTSMHCFGRRGHSVLYSP